MKKTILLLVFMTAIMSLYAVFPSVSIYDYSYNSSGAEDDDFTEVNVDGNGFTIKSDIYSNSIYSSGKTSVNFKDAYGGDIQGSSNPYEKTMSNGEEVIGEEEFVNLNISSGRIELYVEAEVISTGFPGFWASSHVVVTW